MDENFGTVVDEVRSALDEFTTSHKGALAAIRDDVSSLREFSDEQARKLAYLELGGVLSGESDATAQRVDVFNALMTAVRGPASPQLSLGEYRAYREALQFYYRHGQAALDQGEIRATLQVGSDPSGGYTVIPEVDPQPREKLFRTSPMRAIADQLTIMGGEFEGLHETGEFGFGWVGENDTRSETDEGTLAAFRIPARELYALVPVTQRLLDDSAIDFGAWVERRLSQRFIRGENAAFVNGDGVLKPRGFLDYSAAAVTTADATRDWGKLQYVASGAAGGFPAVSGIPGSSDPGALYTIKAALHSEYRADAVWAMNSSTLALMEGLKDGNGRPLMRSSLDTATPDRLLGYPVVIMEDMPDPASDAFSLAFGNFGVGYQIVDKPGIRVLRDPYTTKGKVKFYAYKRVGGDVVNFDAIKLMKFATS